MVSFLFKKHNTVNCQIYYPRHQTVTLKCYSSSKKCSECGSPAAATADPPVHRICLLR